MCKYYLEILATRDYCADSHIFTVYVLYAIANRSVRLSIRHTPVLCQNDGTQTDAVFTVG